MKYSLIWKAAALLSLTLACTQEQNGGNDVVEQNDPKELTITAEAVNVTEWSATLMAFANPTPEMGAIEMGVLYSTEEDPSLENGTKLTSVELDTENKYKVSATGLASETTYYYKSYVLYGGVYRYGKVKSFTTKKISVDIVTRDPSDISTPQASLNGFFKFENTEGLPVEVWFMYMETYGENTNIETLLEYGTKTAVTPDEDGSIKCRLYYVYLETTWSYVACARVYDREFYGDIKQFSIKLTEGTLIDMGVSVKWASCNVGASSPEQYGNYYAWGEINTKSNYKWSSYKFGDGDSSLAKYNTSSSSGTVDNKTKLEIADDAARAVLGSPWRMPTRAEFSELESNCTTAWTKLRGSYGRLFTSKINGNTLFFPVAGRKNGSSLDRGGSVGYYWSSSLYTSSPNSAYRLYLDSNGAVGGSPSGYPDRWYGQSVRPVYEEKDIQKPEAIDLGLSVKWASCNVGAESPEDYGDSFAWGEVTPKNDYSWGTYKWGSSTPFTKYNDTNVVLDPEDDAANALWGNGWRMPTHEDFLELRDNCNWEWVSYNGTPGCKFTSNVDDHKDKWIFLPAVGSMDEVKLKDAGSRGYYWSSTGNEDPNDIIVAWALRINPDSINPNDRTRRFRGFAVRPVCN